MSSLQAALCVLPTSLKPHCEVALSSRRGSQAHLRFAQQSRSDIPHISLLELVVFTVIPIDVNEDKSFDYAVEVESHVYEAVD